MQFVHGRIAQLAIVTDFNLVYLLHSILNIFEKLFSKAQNPPCLKAGCNTAGLLFSNLG